MIAFLESLAKIPLTSNVYMSKGDSITHWKLVYRAPVKTQAGEVLKAERSPEIPVDGLDHRRAHQSVEITTHDVIAGYLRTPHQQKSDA